MPTGALAPFPLRLGGTEKNGITAEQHARLAAMYVALKRTAHFAVWTYTLSGGVVTLHGYTGQNGFGSAHAPTAEVLGTGAVKWSFPRSVADPYGASAPIAIRAAKGTAHGSSAISCAVDVFANGTTVRTFDTAGAAADAKLTVVVD